MIVTELERIEEEGLERRVLVEGRSVPVDKNDDENADISGLTPTDKAPAPSYVSYLAPTSSSISQRAQPTHLPKLPLRIRTAEDE